MAAALTDVKILRVLESVARNKLEWRGELQKDLRLVEDLQLDSLQLMVLVVEVENRFRIILNADEEAGIEKVGDLVRLIAAKTGPTSTTDC
ncbi:MAG: acyl carrier protein [Thermoanaerobaculia bacterium]